MASDRKEQPDITARGVAIPSFRLDERIAVVTGASQGIGRTIAIACAQVGAEIVLASRRPDALDRVRADIADLGGVAHVQPADVSDLGTVRALAKAVAEIDHGRRSKLILVNNAGPPFSKAALDVTEADWNTVVDAHLKGVFFSCQAFAPLMMAAGYGKIVNLSSTWAQSTDPSKSVYSAAKAGVGQLTASLAGEWARAGLRINAIAPTAVVDSPGRMAGVDPARLEMLLRRIPLGRLATSNDLVGAVLFLSSEASDFVTGQTLFVDGGWNAAA